LREITGILTSLQPPTGLLIVDLERQQQQSAQQTKKNKVNNPNLPQIRRELVLGMEKEKGRGGIRRRVVPQLKRGTGSATASAPREAPPLLPLEW
jgi:hypothetical protein